MWSLPGSQKNNFRNTTTGDVMAFIRDAGLLCCSSDFCVPAIQLQHRSHSRVIVDLVVPYEHRALSQI